MTESVNGGEINIIGWPFKEISEIKDADEIFEALKEYHLRFDENRECYPVGLKLDNKITVQDCGSYFPEDEGCLVLGHYFVYKNAGYEISSETTTVESRSFLDWEIMQNPMQGEDYGDFELMGTGDVITEETFALWVLNGESDYLSREIEAPLYSTEYLEEEAEEELQEFSQELFELIGQ